MSKIVNDVYKVKIHPSKDQKTFINKHQGCRRYIYNWGLERKEHVYKTKGDNLRWFDLCKELTQLKKEQEFLYEVNNAPLQQALKDLDRAYTNFFEGRADKPTFKVKGRSNESFRLINFSLDTENNTIHLPKFKNGIKYTPNKKRSFDDNNIKKFKQIEIIREPSGKYYACVTIEREHFPKPKANNGGSIGVDLGIKTIAVTSDGDKFPNHHFLKKYEKKLKYEQRRLAKKQKGSGEFEKQKKKVARIHEKVKNMRKDQHDKISRKLVDNHDTIFMEKLNVRGMKKNQTLAKHIHQCNWGMLREMVQYKGEREEREVVLIPRFYPSSKQCSNCGHIYEDLGLKERKWKCSNCGTTHDRDMNAACNIKAKGEEMMLEKDTV